MNQTSRLSDRNKLIVHLSRKTKEDKPTVMSC